LSASRSALSSTICARPPSRIESPRPRRRIPGNRNLATRRRLLPEGVPAAHPSSWDSRLAWAGGQPRRGESRRAKITSEQAGLNSYNQPAGAGGCAVAWSPTWPGQRRVLRPTRPRAFPPMPPVCYRPSCSYPDRTSTGKRRRAYERRSTAFMVNLRSAGRTNSSVRLSSPFTAE
jgi:hypothetical protein